MEVTKKTSRAYAPYVRETRRPHFSIYECHVSDNQLSPATPPCEIKKERHPERNGVLKNNNGEKKFLVIRP